MEERFTKPFEWILNDKYRILFHILFWLVLYLDEFLSLVGITEEIELEIFKLIGMEVVVDMTLVYVNLYILIPYFLFKKRAWQFAVLSFLTLAIDTVISVYIFHGFSDPDVPYLSAFIGSGVLTATILGTAIGLKIFKIVIRNQQRISELKNTSLQTELAYLKDQINPHFLFNALNNIYVQSRKRPKEASESILLLSDLLRYQLYDCAKEKVQLKSEIEYLQNYLELDRLRKSKAKVDFKVNGTPNGSMVAPFLFIPFVENAIKHGTGLENEAQIDIEFEVAPKSIKFSIENTKPQQPLPQIEGGIGLPNVKRRLALLYPEKHELKIEEGKENFKVELSLDLN